jgi:predicted small secreted protein
MKKVLLLSVLLGIFFSGCATWDGMKEDTSTGWEATKDAVDDALD